MIALIKEELLQDGEDFLIVRNGKIVEASRANLDFNLKNNEQLKVIHLIDKDTQIEYRIHKDAKPSINEIFYEVANSPKIDIAIYLEDNAYASYFSIRKTIATENIENNTNIYLKENSNLKYSSLYTLNSNSKVSENYYLEERNSSVDIKNVLLNTSTKKQVFNININHNFKDTSSNLLNYGICKNKSDLTINSRGIIKEGCSNSQIQQRAKGLLLDTESDLSANPLLEIDNFDVVANHGASIGAIDQDEIFYLMTRGLSKEEAEKLIISGFINPVLEEVKEGKFQDYIIEWVNSQL